MGVLENTMSESRFIDWASKIDYLKEEAAKGVSLEALGAEFGVSRQRMYQVFTKFGIETVARKQKNYLRNLEPKYYWLMKMLAVKGIPKDQRLKALKSFNLPDYCPALGIKLNYQGNGGQGWTRGDDSPSIDKIDPSKGYTLDNIQVLSWRANRIKNDSTPEELAKIAKYMMSLTEKC